MIGLVLAAVLLAGCGIRPDPEPRAIPGAEPVVGPVAGSDSAAAGAQRIYLVGPGDQRLLRSVPRTAPSTANLIEVLLDGPNENELRAQWTSLIPAQTSLLDSYIQGSILFLDLTPELAALPGTVQPQALAQIVYTAAEAPGITAVQITIEGEPQQLPKGNGQATTGTLRPYDYPGFVQSAQPAYPALPSS
ncbi:MAG TPA: GerMN domain-containing protein [Ilumatobacter sp.]|nr:GerMN domain-containing protein [Ilumatobacter sp.]